MDLLRGKRVGEALAGLFTYAQHEGEDGNGGEIPRSSGPREIWYVGMACTDMFDGRVLRSALDWLESGRGRTSLTIHLTDHTNDDLMAKLAARESNANFHRWVQRMDSRRSELKRVLFGLARRNGADLDRAEKMKTEAHKAISSIAGLTTQAQRHQTAVRATAEFISGLGPLFNLPLVVSPVSRLPTLRIWRFPRVGGLYAPYLADNSFGIDFPPVRFMDGELEPHELERLDAYKTSQTRPESPG